MHITEHPSGHFFLRCLLKQEKALLDQSQGKKINVGIGLSCKDLHQISKNMSIKVEHL